MSSDAAWLAFMPPDISDKAIPEKAPPDGDVALVAAVEGAPVPLDAARGRPRSG
jgi:hypothetical protein